MLKNFLMKQALKTQLKGIPEDQQAMLMDMIERNPAFFENLAKELQAGLKSGKDQQTVMMEIMAKHKDALADMVQK